MMKEEALMLALFILATRVAASGAAAPFRPCFFFFSPSVKER